MNEQLGPPLLDLALGSFSLSWSSPGSFLGPRPECLQNEKYQFPQVRESIALSLIFSFPLPVLQTENLDSPLDLEGGVPKGNELWREPNWGWEPNVTVYQPRHVAQFTKPH